MPRLFAEWKLQVLCPDHYNDEDFNELDACLEEVDVEASMEAVMVRTADALDNEDVIVRVES